MSKEITLEEVRKGDRIRMTREITVEAPILGHSPAIRATDERYYFGDGATIELLDRPIDLPTGKGSVIRVSTKHTDSAAENVGIWILTQNPGGTFPKWVSASRVYLTPGEFKEFLTETTRRTFEVIA